MPALLEREDIFTPTENDTQLARESSRRLASHLGTGHEVKIQIVEEKETGEILAIPESALRLLSKILTEMAAGNAITILPVQAELTTQQTADMLCVSRPFLIDLLEKGVIPFRKVGTHRRILLGDVLAYKKGIDAARLETLKELTAQAQELGMGY